jgi:hypothetical protein
MGWLDGGEALTGAGQQRCEKPSSLAVLTYLEQVLSLLSLLDGSGRAGVVARGFDHSSGMSLSRGQSSHILCVHAGLLSRQTSVLTILYGPAWH